MENMLHAKSCNNCKANAYNQSPLNTGEKISVLSRIYHRTSLSES